MQICPQSHQRQKPKGRRAARVERPNQSGRPEPHHERQSQRRWLRQDMRSSQHDRHQHKAECCDRIELFQQRPREQAERGRNGGGGQYGNPAGPSGHVMGGREDELRQPLFGDPRRAREHGRGRDDVRKRPVLDDPSADGDMPINVRVPEQPRRECEQQEIRSRGDEPRHRGAPGKARTGSADCVACSDMPAGYRRSVSLGPRTTRSRSSARSRRARGGRGSPAAGRSRCPRRRAFRRRCAA